LRDETMVAYVCIYVVMFVIVFIDKCARIL